MLLKINRALRNIILIVGALCVIFKLADNKISKPKVEKEEYQAVEFDDIW